MYTKTESSAHSFLNQYVKIRRRREKWKEWELLFVEIVLVEWEKDFIGTKILKKILFTFQLNKVNLKFRHTSTFIDQSIARLFFSPFGRHSSFQRKRMTKRFADRLFLIFPLPVRIGLSKRTRKDRVSMSNEDIDMRRNSIWDNHSYRSTLSHLNDRVIHSDVQRRRRKHHTPSNIAMRRIFSKSFGNCLSERWIRLFSGSLKFFPREIRKRYRMLSLPEIRWCPSARGFVHHHSQKFLGDEEGKEGEETNDVAALDKGIDHSQTEDFAVTSLKQHWIPSHDMEDVEQILIENKSLDERWSEWWDWIILIGSINRMEVRSKKKEFANGEIIFELLNKSNQILFQSIDECQSIDQGIDRKSHWRVEEWFLLLPNSLERIEYHQRSIQALNDFCQSENENILVAGVLFDHLLKESFVNWAVQIVHLAISLHRLVSSLSKDVHTQMKKISSLFLDLFGEEKETLWSGDLRLSISKLIWLVVENEAWSWPCSNSLSFLMKHQANGVHYGENRLTKGSNLIRIDFTWRSGRGICRGNNSSFEGIDSIDHARLWIQHLSSLSPRSFPSLIDEMFSQTKIDHPPNVSSFQWENWRKWGQFPNEEEDHCR